MLRGWKALVKQAFIAALRESLLSLSAEQLYALTFSLYDVSAAFDMDGSSSNPIRAP